MTGSIAPHLALIQPDSSTQAALVLPLTGVRARVFGPTAQTKDLTLTGSVWTGSFTGLDAGTYEVVIEGLANGQTQFYGRTTNITVARGQSASPLIPFAAAVPDVIQPPLANSTSFSQRIPFRSVAAATGYAVEWSQDSNFVSGISSQLVAAADTNPVVTVNATGRWFVRVRAQLPQVLATSVPFATPRGWNVNIATGGNEPSGAIATTLVPETPEVVTARNITPTKQFDWLEADLRAGDSLIVETRAQRLNPPSPLNTVVQLFRTDGVTPVGAPADDFDGTTDSRLAIQVANTEVHKIRVSGAGNTVGHFEISIEIRRLPAAPTGLGVTLTSGSSANLAWTDNADNETGYVVQRCAGEACTNFATIASLAAGATSHADSGLQVNTNYRWRVRAINNVGSSGASNVVTAATFVPAAPASLSATTISGSQIDLAWSDDATNEESYRVERCGLVACAPADFAEIATLPAGSTSYSDLAVAVDNSYRYRVRGVNTVGAGAYSPEAAANTIRPAAPTDLAAVTVSATQVDLSWTDASTNESGFRVERCAGASCTDFQLVTSVAAEVEAFADLTVVSGTVYRYRVLATNVAGTSAPSNLAIADVRPPTAPSTLTATTASATRIDLAWTNTAGNAASLSVRRCAGAGCDGFTEITTLAPTAAAYADESVTLGNIYRYQVVARNAVGDSPASNTAQAATTLPNAPSALTAVTVSATRIDLTWSDNSTDETGFQVERCAGACAQFDSLTTVAAGSTSYSDLSAVLGNTYQYRVAARNIVGLSGYTNTANASTQLPAAPNNLVAEISSPTEVLLAWNDIADNEDEYVIERCAGEGCTDFAEVATAAVDATSAVVGSLAQGTTYRFRVRARNSAGVSSAAGPVTVVFDLPPAVADLRGSVANPPLAAVLNWSYAGVNAAGFFVERCAGAGCEDFTSLGAISFVDTQFADLSVSALTTYRYRLVATNGIGNAPPSNVVELTVDLPNAPDNLAAATVSATQVDLTWTDESNNEDLFLVERCIGVGCNSWATLVTLPAGTTSHSDASVTVGNVYRYRVSAGNALGASAPSGIAEASTVLPAAPSTLAAQTLSRTEIALTWTDNSDNETGFQVERCTGDGCTNFVQVGAAGLNSTAFNDITVQPDSRYRFRVRAFNAAGGSAYSNIAEAATDIPEDPTDLTAVAQSATSIRLSWTDNSSNEIGFIVNRCEGPGCTELQPIAQVAANIETYLDPTVAADSWYSYSVIAFNSGTSRETNVATTNTFVPDTPTELQAIVTSGNQVTLAWTDNANNELSQQVERCLGEGCSDFAALATVAANVVGYVDDAVTVNSTYRYRVRAVNNVGLSAFSAPVEANTILPNTPSGLAAQTLSASAINVEWVDEATNEQGYRVERCVGEACTEFETRALIDPNSESFQDDQVVLGVIYRYRVAAFNVAGQSDFAGPVEAATILPASPTSLSATIVSSARIDLSWTDVADNEDGYRIERCQGIGCSNFAEVGSAPANATTFINNIGVAQNQFYSYRVRAFNASGSSAFTGPISISTFLPAAPTDLVATPVLGTQVDLAWVDAALNESGFRIERCTGDECADFAVIDVVGANVTAYSDLGTTAGVSYRYRAVSFNGIGASAPSNTATVSTQTPAAPTALVATTTSDTRIELSWTDNSTNENGFAVERCAGPGCTEFSNIATLGPNGTGTGSYVDENAVPETAYRYRVRAFIVAASDWSNIAEATTIRPAAPTALVATALSDTRIDLVWVDNADNEDAFRIERCVGEGCSDFALLATVGAGITAYSDVGLATGVTHRYRVQGVNGAGGSAYTNEAAATTDLPGIPTDLVATTLSDSEVQLTWTDNAVSETAYSVERCAGVGCTDFTELVELPSNSESYVDAGIAIPGLYRYRVAARNASGTSGFSNIAAASTAVPTAPTSLVATTQGPTSIQLTWTDNADTELGYRVERCTGVGCDGFGEIASLGANVETYLDESVTLGNSYTYRILATSAAGNSGYTNEATATTIVPAAPSALVAQTISSTQITLTWTNNATNAQGVRVERCEGAACADFVEVASLAATATSYAQTGLEPGRLYRHQVRAVNAAGPSDYSNIAEASTDLPAAPSELVATPTGPAEVTLTWTDNSNDEISFRIERCEGASCGGGDFTEIATVAPNTTLYLDGAVTVGVTYRYRIFAENTLGLSPASNIAETVTSLPTPPADVATAVTGPTSVQVTWTNVTDNRTGVELERCTGISCTDFQPLTVVGAAESSYLDTSADSGTVVRYRLRTINPVGASDYSLAVSAALQVPDGPVALTGVAATSTGIELTWTAVATSASGQVVERCLGADCTDFASVATLPAAASQYADNLLTAGATYRYRVVATNAVGRSAESNEVRVRLLPPLAPTDAVATTVTGSRIELTWVDDSDDELGFRIERCEGESCDTFSEVATVGPDVTVFNNGGLALNTWYRYRVTAFNALGFSGASNVASASTLVPTAPSGLTAQAVTGQQANLAWVDNATNETAYVVERCAPIGCTVFATVDTLPAGAVSYEDQSAPFGTTISYRVRALNAAGSSAASNTASTSTTLAAATSFAAATINRNTIRLSWTHNSEIETGYRVERCTGEGCVSFGTAANLPANTTSWENTGLAANQSYSYRVIPVTTGGEASPSVVAGARTPRVLASGIAIPAQSDTTGGQRHYVLNVPAGTRELIVQMTNGASGTGDGDLYVRFGEVPQRVLNPINTATQCVPYIGGNNESCVIQNPAAGDWYIMIQGYSAYSGVTIEAITPGDLLVFNDLNAFDGSGMANLNNQQLVSNWLNFTNSGTRASGPQVTIDFGRNNPAGTASAGSLISFIQGRGFTVNQISTISGTLGTPLLANKVLILYLPRLLFTASEVEVVRTFVRRGGRVILIGDSFGYYGVDGKATMDALLSGLGSTMVHNSSSYDAGYITLAADRVRADEVTVGVNGLVWAFGGGLTLGTGDKPLIYESSNSVPWAARARVTFP